ncbi:NAD(P)H-hydrate dehydratase [Pelagovum pacificum]
MRAREETAMKNGAVTGAALMERAGRGAVEATVRTWPDLAGGGHHAVVLCGPGNNGGDGYVVARRLADLGWTVEVFGMGDPQKASPDARLMRQLWEACGPVGQLSDAGHGTRPDLLVDALFGTGLGRAIPAETVTAVAAVKARSGARACRVVALDCVSGLDCDSGRMLLPDGAAPDAMAADLTVTFHAAKRGHYLGQPQSRSLEVVDIGLDHAEDDPRQRPAPGLLRRIEPGRLAPAAWLGSVLPVAPGAHKYDRGHVLVLGGGCGKGGAGRLAARAALRIGAGLVTLAVPPSALQENAARLDAIMLTSMKGPEGLADILSDSRLSCVALGPGLGVGEATREMVRQVAGADRATVLDADALSSFSDDPDALFGLLHARCVLTPHEGEFARLFPDLAEKDRSVSKVDAAAEAARRSGATVLLKGPDTVIASPDGAVSVNAAFYGREAPWLGTAGAGDVLTGMIAGLMGNGRADPHLAASAGAWLHVEAARYVGPGLISEDLPDALPGLFRSLGL